MIYVFFKIKSRSQLDTSPLPAPFGQLITMFSPIYPSIISPSHPHCHRPHLSHPHCHHPSLSARHVFPGFCKGPPECTFPLTLLQFLFISKSYFLCESHHVTPFLSLHVVPITLKINPKSPKWPGFLGATPTHSGIWVLSPVSPDITLPLALWTCYMGFPLVL